MMQLKPRTHLRSVVSEPKWSLFVHPPTRTPFSRSRTPN